MTHITLPRAVVEQALRALEYSEGGWAQFNPIITALRAALNEASKEVEPVAWMMQHNGECMGFLPYEESGTVPVFTHPAPAVPVDQCAECKSLGKTSAAMCKQCERDTPVLQVLVKAMLAAAPEVKK